MCSKLDLSKIVGSIIPPLLDFIRLKDTTEVQAALQTLKQLACSKNVAHVAKFNDIASALVNPQAPKIVEDDLYECHLALELCVAFMANAPKSVGDFQKIVLPKVQVWRGGPRFRDV